MHMMMMSDRTLTRDELLQHVRRMFARLDTNKDGYVTRQEAESFHRSFASMGADMHRRIEEHGGMMGDRAQIFDRLDTNHDGMISREEFMKATPQVRERKVVIMRENAGMPRMDGMGMHHMGDFGEHLFAMADKNHDGRVSLQEAESAALAHFDRADLNHDGKVTPEERRHAHEMMRREHRPG
jgi:Ca2+-binding EF-hand superfamily protein